MIMRACLVIFLLLVLTGSAYAAWIFLKTSENIELAERLTFPYKDYSVTLAVFERAVCPDPANTPCTDAEKEYGGELRIKYSGSAEIGNVYIGEFTNPEAKYGRLKINFVSADPKTKKLTVRLSIAPKE